MIPGMMLVGQRRGGAAASGGGNAAFTAVTAFAADGATVGLTDRIGWSFTVLNQSRVCNLLRVRQETTAGSFDRVIIHRNSDSAVIAQVDITIVGTDVWISASVPQFTLVAGVSYTVSAIRGSGISRIVRRNNTVTVDGGFSVGDSVFGTGDVRPTSVSSNNYKFCDFGYS